MFWAEICKLLEFFIESFHFLGGKIVNIFDRSVFVMCQMVRCLTLRLNGQTMDKIFSRFFDNLGIYKGSVAYL